MLQPFYLSMGLVFKKECGITYIKTFPQGFICYLSCTGQQYVEVKSACIVFELHENNLQTSVNMRVRNKKSRVKVGNLVKNSNLYR